MGDKIREIYETERACRVQSSVSVARIVNINDANKEYIMWYVCKQFPQYLPLAQKAVRMLARTFSGKWLHTCYLCGDFILSQPEHLMLYCIKLNQNRETLWYKLICRFGIDYFIVFISNSPESQIDLLYSGSKGILNEEKDVVDCIKIFLVSLSKIPSHLDILIWKWKVNTYYTLKRE